MKRRSKSGNLHLIASSPWTPEEDERLRSLAIKGWGPVQIAEQLNRSLAAVRGRAYKLGVPLRLLKG